MLFSEPGYYEEGKFGIRIENIVRIISAETKYEDKHGKFLAFDDVTLVPHQTSKLLDRSLLTKDEVTPSL